MLNKQNILVVGSGTAGLVSAAILKKFLNCNVDVLSSPDVEIIGVGEGSTEHFKEFIDFVGINYLDLIKECGATLKSGIMFKGWDSDDYFHNVSFPFNNKIAQYSNIYAMQISKNYAPVTPKYLWDNLIPESYLKNNVSPVNQYHFDTFKLNSFLKKHLVKMGINLYEDHVEEIALNKNKEIDYLIGKKKKYYYDFYIDATGFKKLLIKKLGGIWIKFDDKLILDSAITFSIPDDYSRDSWTSSIAMKNGWRFKIPVWDRTGNGYIYSSAHASESEIEKEIFDNVSNNVKINKKITFTAGKIDRAWIKNCVAVGLSSLFVEPMEASSIGATIQQSFVLMHKLNNYNEETIKKYNNIFDDISYNIKDFIFLHYMNKRSDTIFWKDIKNIEPTDFLKENIPLWTKKIPIHEDFKNYSNYILFKEDNFILIMHGLKMFNLDFIKNEFLSLSNSIHSNANEIVADYNKYIKECIFINHNEYLLNIRNGSV